MLFSAGFFTGDKMDDTIAAVSTAFGEGGIGIVRISGEDAGRILDKIFVSDFDIENRKLTYGHIVDPDNGEMIDEVLAVYMKAPNTYTREDVVEIDTHGSVVSLRKTLSWFFTYRSIMFHVKHCDGFFIVSRGTLVYNDIAN